MFWFKKQNKQQKNKSDIAAENVTSKSSSAAVSDHLRVKAMKNARAAREHIGEDNVQKLAAIMNPQPDSTAKSQAEEIIANHDAERVAAQLLAMMESGRWKQ